MRCSSVAQLLDALAGVQHGRVVAAAERIADFRQAVFVNSLASAIAIWRGRATERLRRFDSMSARRSL